MQISHTELLIVSSSFLTTLASTTFEFNCSRNKSYSSDEVCHLRDLLNFFFVSRTSVSWLVYTSLHLYALVGENVRVFPSLGDGSWPRYVIEPVTLGRRMSRCEPFSVTIFSFIAYSLEVMSLAMRRERTVASWVSLISRYSRLERCQNRYRHGVTARMDTLNLSSTPGLVDSNSGESRNWRGCM